MVARDLLDSGAGLECVLAEEMPGTDLELDLFNTDRDLQNTHCVYVITYKYKYLTQKFHTKVYLCSGKQNVKNICCS